MIGDAAFWTGIGGTALISVVTSSAVAGVIQVIIRARYDNKLERLKDELARETDQMRQRFGLVARRQADVVEQVYAELSATHTALLQLTNPGSFEGPPDVIALEKAFEVQRWKALSFFRERRLFLPPALAEDVDVALTAMVNSGLKFRFGVAKNNKRADDWELQDKLWQEALGPMQSVMIELAARFQKLLRTGEA